ncbi:MAG: DegT/DnrJ/EryC1/StrS family aminotransferase [Ginsengibacter sp.]
MDKIKFFNTSINHQAFSKVSAVLQSTLLSEGKLVADFEEALTKTSGIINPVALSSGTAALHLALVVAGIGFGDEVVIPAQTFIATGLAVLMAGAVPVFADIQYETGNINPEDVKKKITDKTKAIIPVHWGGYPCDMDELKLIANKNNILLIEDAAHAIGAVYKNKSVGSISDMTCFSFQSIKHLTTGDGGALACKNADHFEKTMALRWFGIDRKNSPVSLLGEREYNLTEVGYKYHLNDYAAALGLANIDCLQSNLERRREIADYYDNELKGVKGIELFKYEKDRKSSYWLYGFHVENRESFILKLKQAGIPSSVVHLGIHKNNIFKEHLKEQLTVQYTFDNSQIHIPVHNDLEKTQIEFIVSTIKAGW